MELVHFVFLIYALQCSYSEQLPDILESHKCSMKDANFKKCYIENANLVIPEITKGFTELGLPSLTPLHMEFRSLINLPIIQLNITNISFYGINEVKMFDFDLDMDKGILKESLSNSNVTVIARYSMDGKLLLLQVSGNGNVRGDFTNATYYVTNYFEIVKKNGDEYMQRKRTHTDIDLKKAHFDFDGLFGGKEENKELADIVVNAINDNWRGFLSDYGRFIEEFIEEVYGTFFDKTYGSYPIKDLFK